MNIRSLPHTPTEPHEALSLQRNREQPGCFARLGSAPLLLLLSLAAVFLTACGQDIYKLPEFNFAGRPTPPSGLQQRVLVSVTSNGTNGQLYILDGLRDLRNNVQNTVPPFAISGFSGGSPTQILTFPEELRGYVYSSTSPYAITAVNYGTEASVGPVSGTSGPSSQFAIAPDFLRVYSAEEQSGQLLVVDQSSGVAYYLNLPGVYRVSVNRGDTVALAMVRNSNSLYRIVKLNPNSLAPPGAIDCEPNILPVYCVLPLSDKVFDRPYDVVYSLDGSSAYVLNCGAECGGGANGGSGVSFISQSSLQINTIPTSAPYPPVVTSTVPIPGGVTAGLSDSTNLYLSGQQLQPDGLFAGNLTTLNLTTLVPSAPVRISDGSHSKMLFADDNTLWIGSQSCANGERAHQAALGATGQAGNYNCLTRYDLGLRTASIVPNIVPNANGMPSVPFPNQDLNLTYYGSLTGLCWVQNLHKVYTAYGGQVHAFLTADGSEINNTNITVQGTVLDVAYMDALTNSAN